MITGTGELFGDDNRYFLVGNELWALLVQLIGRGQVARLLQTDVELGLLSRYGDRREETCEKQEKELALFHMLMLMIYFRA